MAGSVNKVILIGNLGKDPEVRHMNDGNPIVNLSVATSESWRDRTSGERKERTEWHRVVIFNDKLGEIAQKYLQKGSKVYLEGELRTRKWTDQQGVEKYSTEVVLQRYRGELTMLDTRGGGGGAAGTGSAGGDDIRGGGAAGGGSVVCPRVRRHGHSWQVVIPVGAYAHGHGHGHVRLYSHISQHRELLIPPTWRGDTYNN